MNHNNWLKCIAISSIVCAFVLIASIVIMCVFYLPANLNHNQDISLYADSCYLENARDIRTMQNIPLDSCSNKRLLEAIRKNQMYILERQDKLVDDLRQETNSNLDKINLWLSFWIGILAIMGVLAPVIAEYRFKVTNDIEKDKLSNLLNDYQYRLNLLDAQSAIHSIEISHDERIVSNFSDRDRLLQFLLNDVADSINQLLVYISEHRLNSSKEERMSCRCFLIRTLISLYSVMHRLGTMDVGIRMRGIQNIQTDIRQLIRDTERSYISDYGNINARVMILTSDIMVLFRQLGNIE